MESFWYLVSGIASISMLSVMLLAFFIYRRSSSSRKKDDYTFGSIAKVKPFYRTFTPVKDPSFNWQSVNVQETVDGLPKDYSDRPFATLKARNGGLINDDSDVEVNEAKKWRIWLQVKFDKQSNQLSVTLASAKLVSGRLTPNARWNLFFILYLLPEETIKIKSATHPYSDSITTANTLNLANVGRLGEVFLSLLYDVKTECVTVQIFAARDVTQSSAAVKYYLRILIVVGTRIVKVKSSSISSTVYGVFNYCRSFRIPFQMLNSCCLKFEIVGIKLDDSEEVWGRVVVGSCRYATGKGLEHWSQMCANEGHNIEMWHDILPK